MVTPLYRAAVIGRTGRGNYGHALDRAWSHIPGVMVVAVADEDPQGLRATGERLGVGALYTDYQEMLGQEKPDLVSIGPRWADCHAEMALACAQAGVKGILCEKPFTRNLLEADAILETCARSGTKIAVTHSNRAFDALRQVAGMVHDGLIGELYRIEGRGKEDARGGGEDLMVLGVHVLDLFRLFAGNPLWVSGQVWMDGRDAGAEDVVEGPEGLGPIAGDAILAVYGFPGGVEGIFETRRGLGRSRMGLALMGTEGTVTISLVGDRAIWLYPRSEWPPADPSLWKRLSTLEWDTSTGIDPVEYWNALIATDLVKAVQENREPIASGLDGRASIEMVMGVYASHLRKARLSLPLEAREHPLAS